MLLPKCNELVRRVGKQLKVNQIHLIQVFDVFFSHQAEVFSGKFFRTSSRRSVKSSWPEILVESHSLHDELVVLFGCLDMADEVVGDVTVITPGLMLDHIK